ncbi:MAG: hypothetical protein R3293_09300 [Candidatus Promineifilaceae bacterium]|nr:hypothetical protein [Candidatus Promineifilaceae bacterium]
MHNISAIKRAIYYYFGIMLWLIHWTDTHTLLGIRVASMIRLIALALPVIVWIAGWERIFLVLSLLLLIWILVSYWRARRTGYYRFVADDQELMSASDLEPLPKYKYIELQASGTFSVKDWEKNVVLKPAKYWQVPLGDHGVMVEHEPGRFLYQFFNAKSMQEIKSGWLLYGTHPRPAIAVRFLSIWGPEFSEDTVSLLRNPNSSRPEKMRIIYLSFDNDEQEKSVWQNIVFDARRVRSA